ncbi:MAG: N-acetylmuramoyl-L-alanine amidase [Holophagales bacterium]|nr:N-acetylmuramoyl-L-alanine amidase [Holophagales bacterium]
MAHGVGTKPARLSLSGGDARLKRRLLSGAVEDNVRAIENRPPGRLYRRPPVRWSVAVAGLVALLAALLALAPRLGWVDSGEVAPGTVVATVRAGDPGALPDPDLPPARIPAQVFPVGVQRIVIDPGHGGGDLGTRTPNGLAEKEITLDLAHRLEGLLTAGGFEVSLTRDRDERVVLRDRARFANERGADLFVSIHVNWLEDGRANRGIETYYLGPTDDPWSVRMASSENLESGYSLADVRELLTGVYSEFRQDQSRALAAAIHRRLLRSVRELSPEVPDRGVRSAPFLVLVDTEMPAVLAEVSCLSNVEEARLLARDDYRDRLARALAEGIQAYSHSVRKGG